MSHISTDRDLVTLVNVFTVAPDRQQHLVDLLVAATREVMNRLPGFISANIHQSLDGTRVVNYAQWRTTGDFEAMLANPAAREHMRAAAAIATSIEPHLYRVVHVDEVAAIPPRPL